MIAISTMGSLIGNCDFSNLFYKRQSTEHSKDVQDRRICDLQIQFFSDFICQTDSLNCIFDIKELLFCSNVCEYPLLHGIILLHWIPNIANSILEVSGEYAKILVFFIFLLFLICFRHFFLIVDERISSQLQELKSLLEELSS